MTGSEAISYIHSFSWLGSRPGLSRTRADANIILYLGNRCKFNPAQKRRQV